MAKKRKEEDGALWEAVKASATPTLRDTIFRDSGPDRADTAPPVKPKAKNSIKKPKAATLSRLLPDARPVPKARDLAHGCAPGVDRRTAERLKKGRMEIQGRLDLHGMSREAAHRATINYVTHARMSGKRCILIVTGKGKGILQADLPRWLNLRPLRDLILSFSHAQPQDGGTGAVYVLLKRDRNPGNG